ncbi:major facilitator superfamily transporter [Colletotrichum scovillei]|uniref:Major facilitator superfamily transporter n=1 Tax=Colletotrichum scovillei TaxID=1209932 RepID=A0A9P7R4N3_9PEZI|nr:major facilitator superfamily transporter [Colletotrichum scovillei]KAF4773647.1 major facilitator superfamily transporter [Colletotrichum scovillei]KAG7048627.1 major facilitator superfamily transporter [Colletotrichum scovillei]KAG7065791.1 major facilitator superfamily transporter [Colletotrichum scovillei]KAG7068391.1 major facilitator superfamily transporter [Colletotrichum scovillei]
METNKPSVEQDENTVKGETESVVKPTASNPTPVEWAQHFTSQDEAWHKAMDKTLLRRVDRRLMPTLVVMYLLNFLDRSNLAQARQGTLERDLGMTGTDFNLATSIFFVGYLLMQLPSNLLLTKVKPSFYLAASCCLWGVVSTCNAAADSFTHLIIIRFFLGFVEAPFFPGAVFLMSSWYTRAELTRRIAYLYAGNALANMFGGLLGAGILGGLEGDLGIAGWRWLFIIEGVAAIAFSLVAMWILPDYPHTTKWLSEEERAYAAWRLIEDIQEADTYGEQSVLDGVKMAVRDYRLYIFVLMQHVSLISQTFQYFFPTIVGTLGYGKITTLWLTAPAWAATFLISLCVTWSSAKTKDRSLHIVCLTLVSATGNAIATGSSNLGARYFAMFLMPMGAISAYQIIVSWVANSFPRPLVKRSACIAIANMIGNTATIYGSYMYPSSTGPQYVPGGSANTAICVLVAILALVLRYLHKWENKKLEKAELDDAAALAEGGGEKAAPVDLKQERRAAGFRYIY